MAPALDRVFDRPLVGVGGLIVEDERVLLIRRSKEPGRGRWAIPGGVVELGERLEEAVIREVKEETGLEVSPIRVVSVMDLIERGREGGIEYHYVLIDFFCEVLGGSISPGGDAEEAKWFDLEEALQLELTKGTRILLEELRRPRILVVRNQDVERLLIGPPKGHAHLRGLLVLRGGSIIVLQQATMENMARALLEVLTHPLRRAISLKRTYLTKRKKGFAEYQLLEEDIPDEEVILQITKILFGKPE